MAYENGGNRLIWMTISITLVLTVWGLYALSGAGLFRRLPLLRTVLIIIAAIYVARGLFLIPAIVYVPYPEGAFDYWSSVIVLLYGLVHMVGIWKSWPDWKRKPQ